MSSSVTINVTADDIAEGVRLSCEACPIQRAASRAFNAECTVTRFNIYVWKDSTRKSWRVYPLTKAARHFLIAYDENCHVEPFSFEAKLEAELGGA